MTIEKKISKKTIATETGVSRRGFVKGAAAVTGAAIGSGAITGFPTI